MNKNLLIVFCLISNYVYASNGESKTECLSWSKQRVEYFKNIDKKADVIVEYSCADFSKKKLSLVDEDSKTVLKELNIPLSHTIYISGLEHPKKDLIIVYTDVSEPAPVGSYYYAIIDISLKRIIISGFSDSLVMVENLDGALGSEVVIGKNITGVDPLDTLLDYVPYPLVLKWEASGEIKLLDVADFPELNINYLDKLKIYKKELKKKLKGVENKEKYKTILNELSYTDVFLSKMRKQQ